MAFAGMCLLAMIWYTGSPVLGRVYAGVRIAESGGLWLFTNWGWYFTSIPAGQPFAFISIFKSSIPFGVVAALVIVLIGWSAHRKVAQRHLTVVLATPEGGFTPKWIRAALEPSFPHVLASPRAAEHPGSGPVANPFAELRDLRDGLAVQRAASDLPWHQVAVIALALDAAAPLRSRELVDRLRPILWARCRTAQKGASARSTEKDQELILAALTQCMTELSGRDLPALDRSHAIINGATTTHDLAVALVAQARAGSVFPVTSLAWLSFVDPLLHQRIDGA